MRKMLLARIKSDPTLSIFIKSKCEEEGMAIRVDESISVNDYLVIKVDDYYNSLRLTKTPPSPDCLILQRCSTDSYSINIIELRGSVSSRNFDTKNIVQKFETCFENFMSIKFKTLFFRDYKNVRLYFVSKTNYYKRDLSLSTESFINKKFKFRGKTYLLNLELPSIKIKPCY